MKLRGGLRRELILGLVGIIVLGGLVTHAVILGFSRQSFDVLVAKSDVEIARSVAEALAPAYGAAGSWDGIEQSVRDVLSTAIRPRMGDDDRGLERHGDRHVRDDELPLVVTDATGSIVYPPSRRGERIAVKGGVAVVWSGATVGFTFFKSMLARSYNPRESAFLASLVLSVGLSALIGVVLAVGLGSFFAARFVRPIIELDGAVQRLANGESGARATEGRKDELGHLAGNFNAMARKLESTEAARRALLADIAHELRTPVSVIQANLEMILAGVYAPDRDRLESLYDETRILTDMIGSLREISDLESGVVRFNAAPVRVWSLVAETCEKYRPLFAERGIRVELDSGGVEGVCALSDEDRFRQVIRNVLVNAQKYSGDGTLVTVSARLQGEDRLRVCVADEGPGVSDGELERIFERFYRVDASRNRDSGGRGLGLAICRQFVEASGGSIFARNRQPHGLEVCIDLPICSEA